MVTDTFQRRFNQRKSRWFHHHFPVSQAVTASLNRIFILPTRTSLVFMGSVLIVFLMAANFQNALVYALSFWMASLLIINILFTYRNLSGITVKSGAGESCFAGEKAVFTIEIQAPSSHAFKNIVVGWKNQDAVTLSVDKGRSERVNLHHRTYKRGRFKAPRLSLFSRYPTGLMFVWSYASLDMESIVYPKPVLCDHVGDQVSASDESSGQRVIQGGSSEFSGVREYIAGDAPKHIHWKSYAKLGVLHTKKFVD